MPRFPASLLVVLNAGLALGQSQPGRAFDSAGKILDLPRSRAAAGYQVELTAVVTLAFPGEPKLFVHDDSGGIYVATKSVPPVEAGDLVRLTGKTSPGRFAPVIREADVTRIGRGSLPRSIAVVPGRFGPDLEGRYVSLQATVRSAFRLNGRFYLNLWQERESIEAIVHSGEPAGMPQPGDLVQIQGVASSVFNARAQWLGPRLMVQDLRDVRVIRAAAKKERALPLTPIGELFAYSGKSRLHDPVRVRGVVTCVETGGTVCLQDGAGGLIAYAGAEPGVRVNDSVEVKGFPAFRGYSPSLEDASLTKASERQSILPIAISVASARSGKHDARLVEMTGTIELFQRLQKQSMGRTYDQWFLTLRDGQDLFTAELTEPAGTSTFAVATGSRVRITGVCHVPGPPSMGGGTHAYTLWMRSPDDLAIVAAAPWWTRERAIYAVAALGAFVSLGLIWLGALRRKVQRQTSIIRGQLQLETALEERYRDLFENATDLVFTVDTFGRFAAMNHAARQTFGCKQGDTDCWTLHDLAAADERAALQDIFGILIGGERSVLRQMRVLTLHGTEIVIEMNCRLRHGNDGPRAIEIIARDVTQRKREQAAIEEARRAAEAASRSKSEFLANMSHEIRTPMNGILGMTELTLDSALDPDQRTNLEVVKSSADALLMIINDILDFSKIEAGHMEMDSAPFDIANLVEGCLELISLTVAQKGIELVCDIDPDLPAEWVGDAPRLRQILINLAGNAAKFTHEGEIAVRVDWAGQESGRPKARFQVRDSGIGIPPEQHERIFDVFCQADGSTSRKYGGTGLGLAIASRLVTLLGGHLTLDSVVGQGSCFSFTIDTGALSAGPVIEPASLTEHSVLVREPNRSCREAILRTLTQAGATIVTDELSATVVVSSGEETGSKPLVQLVPPGKPAFGWHVSPILRKPVSGRALIKACQAAAGNTGVLALSAGSRSLLESPTDLPLPRPVERAAILLAEDNKVNQMLAVRTLEKGGFGVIVASNGIEALRLAQERNFDLILMDIQMPEMDGFEATEKICEARRIVGLEPVPVIAMTAHALKGDRERCLARGMADYLAKPVRPGELLQMAEKYTARV